MRSQYAKLQTVTVAVVVLLGACSQEDHAPAAAERPAPTLTTPAVRMVADPPPPFTYWAPEGSTVRNHPSEPGIWIAEAATGARTFYFGDQCHASQRQAWVGQSVDALPKKPDGQAWRIACSACVVNSDLQRDRLSVTYDADTRRVVDVTCS
jgi:hypothetical protein